MTTASAIDARKLALVIIDLQNDFLHPDGAYARGGVTCEAIAALPAKVAPLARDVEAAGGLVVTTHFTLVPGRDGEPLIAPHLRSARPFLRKGDFAAGSFGHASVAEIGEAPYRIEKVAYSAFYMTRLEWLLRKLGVETLAFCGIVTNGGVAATLRDAHVRDFEAILIEDGCAAFSRELHDAAVRSLATAGSIMTCAEFRRRLA